ncbi:aminoglycoside phosphotransferase family protein [Cellulomonas marina]|uniref:Predicted kinase, aminoglycoside phosphotransferase (APT) family n=1 Tax=Cellulomonas marina TaxID=988821 RepID=A0A1I0W4S5_9CELL|nr:aminoglycoside phosphotransferase family protein [Cellulomonas marina]GIG29950.1 phosphotransferase [Cellulomonas marina]SFA82886.1 Predicted kinase, aminoglycoside phosphotransferase (APT) family [Cellulomonas marina]
MTAPYPPPPHPLHEVVVDAPLVRRLLEQQHPDLAGLPLRPLGTGWDNALWRLGDDLVVRLPVRAASAPLVVHEQRWLPRLATRLPVPAPVPVRVGAPGAGFPWPWSVVPWLPGTAAAATPRAGRASWAEALADALAALHVPAPADAPPNPYRGVPLADRDESVRARLDALPARRRRVLVAAWDDGLAADPWTGPPVWLHGDLHPANLLVDGGRLAGLLDFGDVTAGDPASDLATAWLTFDAPGRVAFRARTDAVGATAGVPPADAAATWRRARAWAAALAPVLAAHPDQHPDLARDGDAAVGELARED